MMTSSIMNNSNSIALDPQKLVAGVRKEKEDESSSMMSVEELLIAQEAQLEIEEISQKSDALVASLSVMQMQASTQASLMEELSSYNSKGEVTSAKKDAAKDLPSLEEAAFMQSLGQSYVTMNDMTKSHEAALNNMNAQKEEQAKEAQEENLEEIKEKAEEGREESLAGNSVVDNLEENMDNATNANNVNNVASSENPQNTEKVEKQEAKQKTELESKKDDKEFDEIFNREEFTAAPPIPTEESVDIFV